MSEDLKILQSFADTIEAIIKDELKKIGLGDKYPSGGPVKITNSLGVSAELYKIVVEINDYYIWIVRGRRPLKDNPTAGKPPLDSIQDWVSRRKFQFTDSKGKFLSFKKTAQIVQQIVWVKGVKPRDFLTPARFRIIDAYAKKLADPIFFNLFQKIAKDIPTKVIPILTN